MGRWAGLQAPFLVSRALAGPGSLRCIKPRVTRGDQEGWAEPSPSQVTTAPHTLKHICSRQGQSAWPPSALVSMVTMPLLRLIPGGTWRLTLLPTAGWHQNKTVFLGTLSSHLGTCPGPSETPASADGS